MTVYTLKVRRAEHGVKYVGVELPERPLPGDIVFGEDGKRYLIQEAEFKSGLPDTCLYAQDITHP